MVWFKVDDGLPSHPKVLSIPRGARRVAAIGTWTLAGAWCSKHPAQGGVIPDGVLDELGLPARAAADLAAVGLWLRVEGGYRFHDFHDYNPTAEQVQDLSDKRSAAGRRGGLASGQKRSKSEAKDEALASSKTNPVPARPDPTLKQPPTEVVATSRKRAANGTRIPDNWPSEQDKDALWRWALDHCPAVAITAETSNWQDWHRAKGDTAKDWNASWRTWMRRAQKDAERHRPATARPAASTTDQRVAAALALRDRFALLDGGAHQPELGAS